MRSSPQRTRAGLDHATCHELRHTCLTRLREAGMALAAVQAQAGHASIESTRIYLHLADDWLAAQYPGCAEPAPGQRSRPACPARTVTRRVSVRGAIMIGGQKIQVGLAHARKTAEITVESGTYQITVEPGITITAPRTTSRDIKRHKAPKLPAGLTHSVQDNAGIKRIVSRDNSLLPTHPAA